MDLSEFDRHLARLKDHFFPKARILLRQRRLNAISLRIQITESTFIDVYFNIDSERLDFTTIRGEQRIFGYDNAGGWHYHPKEDPERHEPCPKPTLEEIFEQTARVIKDVVREEP